MTIIRSKDALRSLYAAPKGAAKDKVIQEVDAFCSAFIALSPFAILATMGKDGLIDISPRGDAPGFVWVESETSIVIPDRRGNNRIDTLENIIDNPAIGVLFLVPGMDETLRIQGKAEIDADSDLCARFAVEGKTPQTVLRVHVHEVYFQCAKALMRSRLWSDDYAIKREDFPSMGEIMQAHAQLDRPAETRADMLKRYKDIMY